MSDQAAAVVEAVLDPWCVVWLSYGTEALFGYALTHPWTGGLAWLRSSPVLHIDGTQGRARTESGRHYRLGRRIDVGTISALGLEPWLAYDLLIAPHVADTGAVPPISVDPAREERWLTAQKMSRHLNVTPPNLAPTEVDEFLARYRGAYSRIRHASIKPPDP